MVQAVLNRPTRRFAPAPRLLDVEFVLEGNDLLEAVVRNLDFIQVGSPATSVRAGEGVEAFGYHPRRWPMASAFREDASFRQQALLHQEGWRRGLDKRQLMDLRGRLADAYGLANAESKGAASLALDWLKNAPESSLEAAMGLVRA